MKLKAKKKATFTDGRIKSIEIQQGVTNDVILSLTNRLAALEARPQTVTWTHTAPNATTAEVEYVVPPLPDPDKLERKELWEAVRKEIGSYEGTTYYQEVYSENSCNSWKWHDLGELIGVMFTTHRARFVCYDDYIAFVSLDVKPTAGADIINGDLASAAARAALKFVRGKET